MPTFEQQVKAVSEVGFPIVLALLFFAAFVAFIASVATSANENGKKIDAAHEATSAKLDAMAAESNKRYEGLQLLLTQNQAQLLILIGEKSERSYQEMVRQREAAEQVVLLLAPVTHRLGGASRKTDRKEANDVDTTG